MDVAEAGQGVNPRIEQSCGPEFMNEGLLEQARSMSISKRLWGKQNYKMTMPYDIREAYDGSRSQD